MFQPIVPFPFNVDKEERVSLFSAHGLRWKRFRTLMNPLFSVSKLKTVEPILKDSICAFVNVLEKSAGQCIDIYPLVLYKLSEFIIDFPEKLQIFSTVNIGYY